MTSGSMAWIASLCAAGPIPSPDPLGYPVPLSILQALSYLTLTLHLSAMHFTVGGALLLLWASLRNRSGHDEVVQFFRSGLPLGVSYIVTLGIPPLLFVQVLYGQQFYTSSVLIGAFWIHVIPLVMLAYAGFYYHKLRRGRPPFFPLAVVAACLLCLLSVGYIYVNNLTLMMTPQKWAALYTRSPSGAILHHGEPTVLPRFVLFVSGAFAVAGLSLIWRGALLRRWGHTDRGLRSQAFGFRAFMVTPLLWLAAAVGVYMARPEDVEALFSSGAAVWLLLGVGVVAAATAALTAYAAIGRRELTFPTISFLALLVTTGCMVVLRDMVRTCVLAPYWDMATVPVNAQWGMLSLFLAVLAVGVAFLVVVSMRVVPKLAEGAMAGAADGKGTGSAAATPGTVG